MQETSSTGDVLAFPEKIAKTKVKGCVPKIRFQRGRLTTEQIHHPPFHWIALWVWF
jgi:hypothetical protein